MKTLQPKPHQDFLQAKSQRGSGESKRSEVVQPKAYNLSARSKLSDIRSGRDTKHASTGRIGMFEQAREKRSPSFFLDHSLSSSSLKFKLQVQVEAHDYKKAFLSDLKRDHRNQPGSGFHATQKAGGHLVKPT